MAYRKLRLPVLLSVLAAIITLALKFFAYWMTGSVGLLSDAVESLVNLMASLTALFCLWYASQPADLSHTYGHEKIEYFSSGLEGTLIFFAAAGIAWYAVQRLIVPQPLESLGIGTIVTVGASAINFAVALLLLRTGRSYESIVLEADGQHLMTDVWTSLGVVLALFFVWLTGWEWLDPIIALVMAANITWTAGHLIYRSFNGLMDHALPEREQHMVRTAIEAYMQPGFHFHALRTRQAGARRFVDFHLLVPGAWTVQSAHDLADRIEDGIAGALPGVEVTIHVEPIEAPTSWKDSTLLEQEEQRRGVNGA
jgi:cation diffusion facilitator family transporter